MGELNTKFDNTILAGVNTIIPDFVADIPTQHCIEMCEDAITRVKDNSPPQKRFKNKPNPPPNHHHQNSQKPKRAKNVKGPFRKKKEKVE